MSGSSASHTSAHSTTGTNHHVVTQNDAQHRVDKGPRPDRCVAPHARALNYQLNVMTSWPLGFNAG